MIYDNYYWYYPTAEEDTYKQFEEKFFEVVAMSGAERVGENWTMAQYQEEGGRSEVERKKAQNKQNVKIWEGLF